MQKYLYLKWTILLISSINVSVSFKIDPDEEAIGNSTSHVQQKRAIGLGYHRTSIIRIVHTRRRQYVLQCCNKNTCSVVPKGTTEATTQTPETLKIETDSSSFETTDPSLNSEPDLTHAITVPDDQPIATYLAQTQPPLPTTLVSNQLSPTTITTVTVTTTQSGTTTTPVVTPTQAVTTMAATTTKLTTTGTAAPTTTATAATTQSGTTITTPVVTTTQAVTTTAATTITTTTGTAPNQPTTTIATVATTQNGTTIQSGTTTTQSGTTTTQSGTTTTPVVTTTQAVTTAAATTITTTKLTTAGTTAKPTTTRKPLCFPKCDNITCVTDSTKVVGGKLQSPSTKGKVWNICGKFYLVGSLYYNYKNAYQFCCSLGMELASLETDTELNCVTSALKAGNSPADLWISATCGDCHPKGFPLDGYFLWCPRDNPDGVRVQDSAPWIPTIGLNDAGGNQHNVQIQSHDTFNDWPDTDSNQPLCEGPLSLL